MYLAGLSVNDDAFLKEAFRARPMPPLRFNHFLELAMHLRYPFTSFFPVELVSVCLRMSPRLAYSINLNLVSVAAARLFCVLCAQLLLFKAWLYALRIYVEHLSVQFIFRGNVSDCLSVISRYCSAG
jgi:hypothetical protein